MRTYFRPHLIVLSTAAVLASCAQPANLPTAATIPTAAPTSSTSMPPQPRSARVPTAEPASARVPTAVPLPPPGDQATPTNAPLMTPKPAPTPDGLTAEQRALLAQYPPQGAAPELQNKVWLNSEPLRLAHLRGKVVLLDMWTFG